MLIYVPERYRTTWEENVVQDEKAVSFRMAVGGMYLSEGMINTMLSFSKFRMYYDGNHIGYGLAGTSSEQYGMTEPEAYSLWLKDVTDKERLFRLSIPLINLTQTQYDALFSLYYHTGSWKRMQGPDGEIYDVEYAVKRELWLLVADMLASGTENSHHRRKEAWVLKLASYQPFSDRNAMRFQGIQDARKTYTSNKNLSRTIQQQIEHAYYRQLGAFVPTIPDLRKKQLINLYGKF